MFTALLVAVGGAIGTVARYLLTQLAQRLYGSSIPGTLLVNVLGSLGLGLLLGLQLHAGLANPAFTSFFELGVFGGFTTFSMFVFELVQRRNKNNWVGFSYIVASIGLSMLAVLLGMWLVAWLGGGL